MMTIVSQPEKDQLETIKAILNALKIPFEEKNQESISDYVVKGIKASQIQVAEGKITHIQPSTSNWDLINSS